MAVRDSEKLLENLLNYVNSKKVRDQIDKFQEIVTLEKSNLVECWKDGYNALKKKHKNKDLNSGETWDWNKGVDDAWPLIQSSLETFRNVTINSRLSNNNTIVFTSPKNDKKVYDAMKQPSVAFIEKQLKRKLTVAQDEIDANPGKFLDNKGKANYQAAAGASDVGLIKSSTVRLHRQGSTVGAGQYITAMKWIEKTKFFKDFLTSGEYTALQDKYGPLKLNYVASGTKKRGLKISPNEEIQIDINRQFIKINIHDNGPGISDAEKVNVFKPFYRLDKSRNQNQLNSGLGLSITKSLLSKINGNIKLKDSYLGGLEVEIKIENK